MKVIEIVDLNSTFMNNAAWATRIYLRKNKKMALPTIIKPGTVSRQTASGGQLGRPAVRTVESVKRGLRDTVRVVIDATDTRAKTLPDSVEALGKLVDLIGRNPELRGTRIELAVYSGGTVTVSKPNADYGAVATELARRTTWRGNTRLCDALDQDRGDNLKVVLVLGADHFEYLVNVKDWSSLSPGKKIVDGHEEETLFAVGGTIDKAIETYERLMGIAAHYKAQVVPVSVLWDNLYRRRDGLDEHGQILRSLAVETGGSFIPRYQFKDGKAISTVDVASLLEGIIISASDDQKVLGRNMTHSGVLMIEHNRGPK